MNIYVELWCLLSDYLETEKMGRICICVTKWNENYNASSRDMVTEVAKNCKVNGKIDKPGLWSLHIRNEDNSRHWMGHFRIEETDEGLAIADELFSAPAPLVTRWPPKR